MNRYLIWFCKSIIIVVCLVCIDYGVGKVADFVEKVHAQNAPSFVENVLSRRDDIIIIGSSTANHTYISNDIRDSIGLSVFNAGKDGRFFVSQNCLINLILDNYSPRYILWEIGEHSLSDNFGKDREFQSETDYYPYYSNPYIKEVYDKKDSYNRWRMMSNMYKDNSNIFVDVYHVINQLILKKNRPGDGNKSMRKDGDNNGYSPLTDGGMEDIQKITFPISIDNINEDKVSMLIGTINRCKSNGVKIIFTSSPRYYIPNVLQTKSYLKLKDIANIEGIPILNFYTCDSVVSKSEYFRDNDHLFEQGSEDFMSIFIPELKRVLLYY